MDKIKVKIKMQESDFLSDSDITKVKITLPMVDPRTITLESELYTISSNPVTEKVMVEKRDDKIKSITPIKSLVDSKYFAINRHPVSAISIDTRDNDKYVTVNGEIHLKVGGSSERGTIENMFFTDFEDVKEVCRIATKVELDKIKQVKSEIRKVEDFLQRQSDSNTF